MYFDVLPANVAGLSGHSVGRDLWSDRRIASHAGPYPMRTWFRPLLRVSGAFHF